jgi:predicted neuraminidase
MHKQFVVRDVTGQCHASTVATMGGSFVVAWFQGDHEGAPNSQIWLTRARAEDWVPPSVVSGDLAPCWNPVLHVQISETWGESPRWDAFVDISDDDGFT